MSSTTDTASATSSSSTSTSTSGIGSGQAQQGISLVAFLTALATSLVVFGIQMLAFLILRNKLARIFKPKTYLVPERERTEPPPRSPWGWLIAIFRFRDREVINKCGLDAYFFLRYLQTLLIIFIPAGAVILPILLPLNKIGGRGPRYALEVADQTGGNVTSSSAATNVTGLDVVAWGNVRPNHTNRYWGHLILAILVIIWVCGVFFAELRVYIKVRQDYLTSAEHRLRASATTVLVSAIPRKWLTTEALAGLYDVFPGGIRNIWINRKFDELLDKIHEREKVFQMLESAETELIRKAKKKQREQSEKDEKLAAKQSKAKRKTKQERTQKMKDDDALAKRLAQSGGVEAGDPHQVPHTVDDAIDEEEERHREQDQGHEHKHEPVQHKKGSFKIPVISGGLAAVGQGFDAVGQGLGKGFDAVGKVGDNVIGGTLNVGRGLNNQIETTNGFMNIDTSPITEDDSYDEYGRYRGDIAVAANGAAPYGSGPEKRDTDKKVVFEPDSPSSSRDGAFHSRETKIPGNTTRKATFHYGGDSTAEIPRNVGWWKFWQGPAGGFASPLPTGYEEGDEFPLTQADGAEKREKKEGAWAKFKAMFAGEEVYQIKYPIAYNENYKEDAHGAVWEKYLLPKDRPTHRLAKFSWTPGWLPGLPLINEKVDTIYWCRGQLARLNLEIEMDQKHPERFPLMNSAFIQFNHQVAAHMACQSVTHHVPKHMAPRTVEISPKDVLWDNMSIKWWESWLRTSVVFGIVAGMVILWAFPVAFTSTLGQLSSLANQYSWLHWLKIIPANILKAISGVLPAIFLAILLAVVPMILSYLAFVQGAQTGTERERSVQNYYFAFLFVQVFLVVSVSTGALVSLVSINSSSTITAIPETLATQLPKAANYFFSYMILQALSTSSGTLLQIATLVLWFVMPKLFDNTARQKWTRNTTLPTITWGTFFPVYTNFACISLIYIVVSPLIIVFAVITFALLWIANRYNMLYVSRFVIDTGGLLYPRAINQTFTGLYVMEICLIGLFFLVRDEKNNPACIPQAIIMIVAAFLTVLYQILLNWSFGPLFLHLPITFEDEAVLRDEAFERAQARRLGLDDDEERAVPEHRNKDSIEMSKLDATQSHKFSNSKFNPINVAHGAGSWAVKGGRNLRSMTWGGNSTAHDGDSTQHPQLRKKRHHRDIEAQKKIADALYGGYNDDIEDLTPDERDVLVRHAFQHYALRARRPTVWIPRDDIGVSDDEIKRTREFAGNNIWISNVGAALDGKSRVVYGRNPPDFSEIDLINL